MSIETLMVMLETKAAPLCGVIAVELCGGVAVYDGQQDSGRMPSSW